jgi:hypothetical protein
MQIDKENRQSRLDNGQLLDKEKLIDAERYNDRYCRRGTYSFACKGHANDYGKDS